MFVKDPKNPNSLAKKCPHWLTCSMQLIRQARLLPNMILVHQNYMAVYREMFCLTAEHDAKEDYMHQCIAER